MLVAQCNLQNGNNHITCWLEANRVKPGYRVTLKNSENPTEWWTVVNVGGLKEQEDIKGSHNSEDWHKKDYRRRLHGLNIMLG